MRFFYDLTLLWYTPEYIRRICSLKIINRRNLIPHTSYIVPGTSYMSDMIPVPHQLFPRYSVFFFHWSTWLNHCLSWWITHEAAENQSCCWFGFGFRSILFPGKYLFCSFVWSLYNSDKIVSWFQWQAEFMFFKLLHPGFRRVGLRNLAGYQQTKRWLFFNF